MPTGKLNFQEESILFKIFKCVFSRLEIALSDPLFNIPLAILSFCVLNIVYGD